MSLQPEDIESWVRLQIVPPCDHWHEDGDWHSDQDEIMREKEFKRRLEDPWRVLKVVKGAHAGSWVVVNIETGEQHRLKVSPRIELEPMS